MKPKRFIKITRAIRGENSLYSAGEIVKVIEERADGKPRRIVRKDGLTRAYVAFESFYEYEEYTSEQIDVPKHRPAKEVKKRTYHTVKGFRTIFNGNAVVVWAKKNLPESKEKTVATCSKDDHFDPVVGFCIAYTANALFNGSKKKMKEVIHREFRKQNKA